MSILMGYNHNKNDDLGNKNDGQAVKHDKWSFMRDNGDINNSAQRYVYIYITGHNGILMGYYLEINKIQVDIMEYSQDM